MWTFAVNFLCKVWERFVNGQKVREGGVSRLLQSVFLTVLCRVIKEMLSLSLEPVSELFQLQWSYPHLLR